MEYIRLYIIMVDMYSYLERENYLILKFRKNNSSDFEICTSLF